MKRPRVCIDCGQSLDLPAGTDIPIGTALFVRCDQCSDAPRRCDNCGTQIDRFAALDVCEECAADASRTLNDALAARDSQRGAGVYMAPHRYRRD